MKITSKRIFVFLVFCLIIHFFTTNTYAKTDVITGYVQEAFTLDSDNKVTTQKGIGGINLNVTDNLGNSKVVTTDSEGKYEISLENAESYNVQLSVPNVTEEEINNIKNQESFNLAKNKLKYNPQDYFVSTDLSSTNISITQKDKANVYLILDISQSMAGTKIVDLAINCRNIINSLLTDENKNNIKIEIITFATEGRRKKSLTNDRESLISAVDGIYVNPDNVTSTQMGKGLEIAKKDIQNRIESNQNNFVFILTDGETFDIEKSKQEMEELIKMNVNFCAILINGDNDVLKKYCGENYHKSKSFKSATLQKDISDFIMSVEKSIQIEEQGTPLDLSNEADKDYRNSQLKAFEESGYNELFRHKTTYYFKCLEMNYNDLTIFKNYAKDLIKNHNDVIKTKEEIKTLSQLMASYSKEKEFKNKGPNFYFLQKPKYTLSPTIKISNVNLVSANGPSLIDKKVPIDRPSYFPIQDKDLYGSTLKLKYSVEVKNLSEYNAKTDYIKLICYIPKNSVFIDYKIIGKNVNKSSVNLFSDKVSQINKNSIDRELKQDEQYLSKDIYLNIEKGNYAAVIFDIPTNKNGFNFTKNASLYIEYQTNSILDYNDDLLYNGFVEILGYTNKQSIRRLQETNVIGAVAGNDLPSVKKIEIDSARSNDVVLLEPTGADKKITFVKVLLTICIISSIIIIFIKRKLKGLNVNSWGGKR